MESSRRDRTVRALEFLKKEFGSYPKLYCNHGQNRENLYWGCKRFQTALLRQVFRLIRREPMHYYSGELEGSEFFWGDLSKEYIKYVRNFTFRRLNILEVNPEMPYRLPSTKNVNYWFSTSDAPDVDAFNRLLSLKRLDTLEENGGVCIVSTHLGKGFARQGNLNSETKKILRYLAEKPGWFVPVSDILDYLLERRPDSTLGYFQRLRLEVRFVIDKIIGLRGHRAETGLRYVRKMDIKNCQIHSLGIACNIQVLSGTGGSKDVIPNG